MSLLIGLVGQNIKYPKINMDTNPKKTILEISIYEIKLDVIIFGFILYTNILRIVIFGSVFIFLNIHTYWAIVVYISQYIISFLNKHAHLFEKVLFYLGQIKMIRCFNVLNYALTLRPRNTYIYVFGALFGFGNF